MTFAVARSSSSSHIPSGQPWLGILHIQTAKAFQEFRGNGGGGVTAGEQTLMKHRTKPTEGGGGGADSQGSQFHVSRGVRCPRSTSLPNPAVNQGLQQLWDWGGFQSALSRIINAKPRSRNSILSPALQSGTLGKVRSVRFMKAMVWGIYTYFISI